VKVLSRNGEKSASLFELPSIPQRFVLFVCFEKLNSMIENENLASAKFK